MNVSYEPAPGDIAIVGMAGRFAGTRTPRQLWDELSQGKILIQELSREELAAVGIPESVLNKPEYVRRTGLIEDVECFDAAFFGIGARDAAIMDPQHRHFLECSWEALEDAAHPPSMFKGRIGVYAGCGMNTYMLNNLLTNPSLVSSLGMFLLRHTANDKDFLSTGVSYRLNLKGPSVSVQTACSTSLVAVHLAVQALLAGECDMALAGGSTIQVPHQSGYMYQPGEILSQDGFCRPFDAASSGTVLTNGVGAVVLRRVEDAIADGDCIQAIIKATAINNDGSGKVSYLAPSVDGHSSVITEAMSVADITADTIQYFETHGTGTSVGDPIEFAAITRAYGLTTKNKNFIHIGSVKANIGHTDTAAGVASLIKVVEALKHETLPPLANYTAPNPSLNLLDTPLTISNQAQPWQTDGGPRRAGLSSLGVGGTNAHAIIEEAPQLEAVERGRPWQTLVLSAKTDQALEASAANLARHLTENPGLELADVAYTLQIGRMPFEQRMSLSVSSIDEARELLDSKDAKRVFKASHDGASPSLAFLFPGVASEYPNMGRDFYEAEAVYRETVDRCLEVLMREVGLDLRPLLYPEPGAADTAAELARPSFSQPAIFIAEYALAQLLMSWGLQPDAMNGHSLGEFAAACVAGVFTLEDALKVVAARGRLVEQVGAGAMLSVPMSADELRPLLTSDVSLAVINSPDLCVVSGSADAIDAFEAKLATQDVQARRLHIDYAMHSHLLDPALAEFRSVLEKANLSAPTIPFVSNLYADWITPAQAKDPGYWVTHLRETVNFTGGFAVLVAEPNRVLLEVGPGTTLTTVARLQPVAPRAAISTSSPPNDQGHDAQLLMSALGRLWLAGIDIDWATVHGTPRRRVQLPTYPFQRQRHWIEAGKAVATDAPLKIADVGDWFSRPVWKQANNPRITKETLPERWLVFEDEVGLGAAIANRLRSPERAVVSVRKGDLFRKLSADAYEINPNRAVDYEIMLADLNLKGFIPQRVVHAWSLTDATGVDVDHSKVLGYDSLLNIAKSLADVESEQQIGITVLVNGLQRVLDESVTHPENALTLGPVRVIPREFPGLICQSVDVTLASHTDKAAYFDKLAGQLIDEAADASDDTVVAYRGSTRWVQEFESVHLDAAENQTNLSDGGVYLITGGLGHLGLVLAKHIASSVKAPNLVLISRSGLPPREEWARRPIDDAFGETISTIREIEALGANVTVRGVDISDSADVSHLLDEIRASFGGLDGVYHAAGVIDDGLVVMKSDASSRGVLLPKVQGTLALDRALQTLPPRFVVLYSSTSAILGVEGQVDYTAANAFLDAFAASKEGTGGPRYTAVNWGIWTTGAPTSSIKQHKPLTAAASLQHPILKTLSSDGNGNRVFSGQVSPANHWVIDEHRLMDGSALLPGAGYIDLVISAARRLELEGSIEIKDMFFVSPLVIKDLGSRDIDIRLSLDADTEAWSFEVASRDSEGAVSLHALGQLEFVTKVSPDAREDLDAVMESVGHGMQLDHGLASYTRQGEFLQFGPRWQSLKTVHFGATEAWAELELPKEFAPDLESFPSHPALFDLATGFALPLIDEYQSAPSSFVPMGVGRLKVLQPIPSKVYSHASLASPGNIKDEVITFNVQLLDEAGAVVCEVENYAMKRLDTNVSSGYSDQEAGADVEDASNEDHTPVAPLMKLARTEGISPAEGMEALARVQASWNLPQVVISSLSLSSVRELLARNAGADEEGSGIARPELSSNYEAPRDQYEQFLAEAWQEYLGIERVGIKDDFFELGGHSLIAVRVFARIKKAYSVELPLSTLFIAPTIEQFAAAIRAELGVTLKEAGDTSEAAAPSEAPTPSNRWPSLVPIQPNGSRPPLFCVHGMAGNVLNFRDIAMRLGKDQPFYALQAFGLNGIDKPHETIEEMAAFYVEEVQRVRPHGPYYLAGYSGGGIIMVEMARILRAAGEVVALEAMIESWTPWLVNKTQVEKALNFIDGIRHDGPSFVPNYFKRKRTAIRLIEEGLRLGTADVYDPETVDMSESFVAAVNRYEIGDVEEPLLLLRATERAEIGFVPRDLGWSRYIKGNMQVVDLPGGHETMFTDPYSRGLAAALREAIDARLAS